MDKPTTPIPAHIETKFSWLVLGYSKAYREQESERTYRTPGATDGMPEVLHKVTATLETALDMERALETHSLTGDWRYVTTSLMLRALRDYLVFGTDLPPLHLLVQQYTGPAGGQDERQP